ncbi:hypothetical protein ACLOJK_006598, partial [Asimina triloba]
AVWAMSRVSGAGVEQTGNIVADSDPVDEGEGGRGSADDAASSARAVTRTPDSEAKWCDDGGDGGEFIGDEGGKFALAHCCDRWLVVASMDLGLAQPCGHDGRLEFRQWWSGVMGLLMKMTTACGHYWNSDAVAVVGRNMLKENGKVDDIILWGFDPPIGPHHTASPAAAMAAALDRDGGAPYSVLHGSRVLGFDSKKATSAQPTLTDLFLHNTQNASTIPMVSRDHHVYNKVLEKTSHSVI